MPQRLALISDHASPLAVLGSVDSGGQNVYVGQVARKVAARDHSVDIFTRRYGVALPRVVEGCPGVRVIHVPAGPSQDVRKEGMLSYMNDLARWVIGFCRMHGRYDLLHANFFMSGGAARACGCRTPAPGLLLQAAAQRDIDLAASWIVGDILGDVEAGHRAGCRSVQVGTGNETEWARSPLRVPDYVARDFADAAAYVARARGRRTAPKLGEHAR